MSRPNLSEIFKMLEKGKSFSLTNKQYKQLTGCDIPKDIKKCAIKRYADGMGFNTTESVNERVIVFNKR